MTKYDANTNSTLYIARSPVALALVLFQYYYKNKRKGKLQVVLSFFRFCPIWYLVAYCKSKICKKNIFGKSKFGTVDR